MVRAQSRWALRDWLAAIVLFAATAAVVFWQNAHVAVLWDLSYVLDTATRIAEGQLPYRDFPFAHAPLTFLIQAAIIRLTGHVFLHHVLYAVIIGAFATVLTWRITLRNLVGSVTNAWFVSLILTAPLTVLGLYSILPLPSYDCDTAFAVLVAIFLLQRLKRTSSPLFGFATGAALCVPLFFKQNIGLPFLAAVCTIIAVALVAEFSGPLKPPTADSWRSTLFAAITGIAVTLAAALLVLHFTVGLGNYLHWTIQFAAQRRLPGLQQMIGVYRDPQLLWKLPCMAVGVFLLRSPLPKPRWTQILALLALTVPFLYTLSALVIYDNADERGDSLLALWPMLLIIGVALALRNLTPHQFRSHCNLKPLLPIVILAAIHGTLMSQQLWGSTYAIWPLLILLIADMIAYLPSFARTTSILISLTLLICGAFYTYSEERLSYAQFPDQPVQHSSFAELKGLSTPGPYLPDFDELLRYADANIPRSDGIILIPGEDPFYFATARTPQFPVLLFDPATDPLSPTQVVEAAIQHKIRWLIVKRDLQLTADPTPQREATLDLLLTTFKPAAHLRAYDIYQSR